MGSKIYNFKITDQEIRENLRENLRKSRKTKFKTQEAFAEALDVSIESVRNWEQGRVIPEIHTLIKIAYILECDLDYLIGRIKPCTHSIKDIQEDTQLTEESIKTIIAWKKEQINGWGKIAILSKIIVFFQKKGLWEKILDYIVSVAYLIEEGNKEFQKANDKYDYKEEKMARLQFQKHYKEFMHDDPLLYYSNEINLASLLEDNTGISQTHFLHRHMVVSDSNNLQRAIIESLDEIAENITPYNGKGILY